MKVIQEKDLNDHLEIEKATLERQVLCISLHASARTSSDPKPQLQPLLTEFLLE